jgi:O-antigen/teichoic acid export membrane protein
MNFIKKILLSPSLLVLIDQGIFSGTNFLLTLFLAQKLDIKNFGLFSTIVLVTYLVMSITNALIIQPFQVSIAKISKRKEYYVSLFLGLAALLLLFMFLVKLLVLFLPNENVYGFQSNAIICFVVGYLLQDFFRKIFLAIANIVTVVIIDIVFLVLISIAFYALKTEITLFNSLLILGLANIVSSIPGLYFIIKNYEKPVSWKSFLQDHITQGKWLFSVAILQWGSSNFFVLISGVYLGIEALGALRLVQSFFGIINIVLQTVENYFLPKVAVLYNENIAKAKKYLLEITAYGALLFGILLSILFVFSNEIIVLAGGNKYESYGYVVKIIAVLYFFIFLSYPVRIAVRIMVLNKIFFIGYLLSFVSSLLTFHFLLKYSGLYGAATGLIINQIIMILYWQNQLRKKQFLLWK